MDENKMVLVLSSYTMMTKFMNVRLTLGSLWRIKTFQQLRKVAQEIVNKVYGFS